MKGMNIFNAKAFFKMALLTVLTAVIAAGAACAITQNNVVELVNRPAPDFTLKDLNGNNVRLSGLLGKTVLINFWATTCPPCVTEMPIFQKLYNEWKDRGDVLFLSINLGEDAEKVRLFVERRNYSFPILLDADWQAGRVYQIHYTPTSCLVDNQGVLRLFSVGAFPDKAALDKKLAGFMPAQP